MCNISNTRAYLASAECRSAPQYVAAFHIVPHFSKWNTFSVQVPVFATFKPFHFLHEVERSGSNTAPCTPNASLAYRVTLSGPAAPSSGADLRMTPTKIQWLLTVRCTLFLPLKCNEMDINQLEVLVTVAREKSFSRAAEVLNRTQPAISQAIRRLEAEIGEKLFDRSSKDGTLTFAGEVLLTHAKQMMNLRQNAQQAIREMRDLKHGKVTISANEHTVFFLLPVIEEFRRRHPLIKIEVQRGVASRIPKQITAREVELGIISFAPNDESLRSVSAMTDQLVLIVSPTHRLADRAEVSIKELGEETFVAHNAPSPYRQKVIETFEKHKTSLQISVELPSLEAIKRLVARGVGLALVPRITARAEVAAGLLSELSVKEMKLERRLNIIYRRNSELSHAAKAFLKVARDLGS